MAEELVDRYVVVAVAEVGGKNKIAAKYSSTSLAQNSQRGANFLLKAEQVNKV